MVGRKSGRKRYRLGELMVQREALVREADPGEGQSGEPGGSPACAKRASAGRPHLRIALLTKKSRLAGRSARRRIRYGYQSGPKGVATRTRKPPCTSSTCRRGPAP